MTIFDPYLGYEAGTKMQKSAIFTKLAKIDKLLKKVVQYE